jgi:hypothetical protein
MRTLRVLGLAEDGESLVCGDQHSGELFAVPTDERLRAAARGDLTRLGQLEIEMEPQLRPREIQARIRAGASIEEVATAASTRVDRIERYAYPVLLERSTMAERARQAHPVIDGNPTKKTLDELVTAALAERGQCTGLQWDAYRDDDSWVLILRWQAGRSENRAHWAIQPGPRTNTLRPKDDAAREILDPTPRTLREIHETKTATLATDQQASQRTEPSPPGDPIPGAADLPAEPSGSTTRHGNESVDPAARHSTAHHPAGNAAMGEGTGQQHGPASKPATDPADEPAAVASATRQPDEVVARTGTDHQPSRSHRRGHRPVMPGWEDILLGGGSAPQI